jgi:hypothetical protein
VQSVGCEHPKIFFPSSLVLFKPLHYNGHGLEQGDAGWNAEPYFLKWSICSEEGNSLQYANALALDYGVFFGNLIYEIPTGG